MAEELAPPCDQHGIPLRPGDLVRTPHFRDRSYHGKRRWLYHVVCAVPAPPGCVQLVPACYLAPTVRDTGGRVYVRPGSCWQGEVIYGAGSEPYEQRPRTTTVPDLSALDCDAADP